jgi:GDP-mannose 6-dehydrogenase
VLQEDGARDDLRAWWLSEGVPEIAEQSNRYFDHTKGVRRSAMRVSVFGVGYVGTVSMACLARDGHDVIGVDVNAEKARAIGEGRSPVVEPGLEALLREGVAAGSVRTTTDPVEAIRSSEVSLISVGTPPGHGGAPDLSAVWKVTEEIAAAMATKETEHTFVLRSTVPAGTLDRCAQIIGRKCPIELVHLACNPEFLREGSSIADYDHPAYTVIGTRDDRARQVVEQLYSAIDAPLVVVEPEVAELTKTVMNAWHATKITFANEIGRLAKSMGVDGRQVMDLLIQDRKLNISPTYLRPGFAYGGSCLPKDVLSLVAQARAADVSVPLLASLPQSNAEVVEQATRLILDGRNRRIAVLGLAFKANTDDLRESAAVTLVKRLLGEGCRVRIYDKDVHAARLVGTNLAYIQENLPHFQELLVPSLAEALEDCETVVVTYVTPEFQNALDAAPSGLRVVDLAGLPDMTTRDRQYAGIAW